MTKLNFRLKTHGHVCVGSSADAEQPEEARKKRKLGCQRCDFTAEKRAHLTHHEKIEHEGMEDLKSHKCDMCGYSAKRYGQLTEHRRRVHERVKRFKCRDEFISPVLLMLGSLDIVRLI